jgi:phosphomannomutase
VLIDDDGQRCAFLDEAGALVSPARMTRLLAALELENQPAGAVVIGASGGEPVDRPILERVVPAGQLYDAPATLEGTATMLQKHQGVLGGDDSGRYWFADPFPTSDAVLTLAKVLQALSRSDREFSKVA